MIVLTLLVSEPQVERVRAAAPSPHRILRATSATDARVLLREQPADVIVLDPVVGSAFPRVATSASELFEIAVEFPYLPVVFYVSNAAKALPLLARFPTREGCAALVAGIDDNPHAIGSAIDLVVTSSLVGALLRQLMPTVTGESVGLVTAIRQVFSYPAAFRNAQDVASAACMSRRTLDRSLRNHRLVPGSQLLQAARAFVAVRAARDGILAHDEAVAIGGRLRGTGKWRAGRVAGVSREQIVRWTDDDIIACFTRWLRGTKPPEPENHAHQDRATSLTPFT
jgi:hypothetical protein